MSQENQKLYEEFKRAFQTHYIALCNYAYTFLKQREEAEDLVQDVFVKIWEKHQEVIDTTKFRFYLFAAVRNNCLTFLKNAKKNSVVALVDNLSLEDPNGFYVDPPSKTDFKAILSKGMDDLPPKCKEVFLLSRISHKSYREIADLLNISVKTVENQISKALKILRAVVKESNMKTLLVWVFFLLELVIIYRGMLQIGVI
ncbi:MAG: RNA polymerase sigma-70 factor [Flavisolibacter sp.]